MENCIFVDRSDVVDKLDYVFQDQDLLARITQAGHDLVHSRHTISHRDQIYQWFVLNSMRTNDQRIIQAGPFGPLSLSRKASAATSAHLNCQGIDRPILREGYAKLESRDYRSAEVCFYRCLNFFFFPEATLGLAISRLHQGQPDEALRWIEKSITDCVQNYQTWAPDPVEWAYVIVCFLCKGDVGLANVRAGQFPGLSHPLLDHCRVVLEVLQPYSADRWRVSGKSGRSQPSIHFVADQSFTDWVRQLRAMLVACGQAGLSDRLRNVPRPEPRCDVKTSPCDLPILDGRARTCPVLPLLPEPRSRKLAQRLISLGAEGGFARPVVLWAARKRLFAVGRLIPVLRRLKKTDELCRSIAAIAGKAEVQSVLVITADRRSPYTESLVESLRKNPAIPELFVVAGPSTCASKLLTRLAGQYGPGLCTGCNLGDLERLTAEREFGIVLVDGPLPKDWTGTSSLLRSGTIIVRGTTTTRIFLLCGMCLQADAIICTSRMQPTTMAMSSMDAGPRVTECAAGGEQGQAQVSRSAEHVDLSN